MEFLMVKIINYGFVLTLAAFAVGAHASETEPAVQLPNVSNSNNSVKSSCPLKLAPTQ
jgi:hypothetical protein